MSKIVHFYNLMQRGSYTLVRPAGNFKDFPEFKPFYTPGQMLHMGVFEGKYLNSCRDEYPASWFRGVKMSDVPDENVNYFKLKSRMPLAWWLEKDLINAQDPRGWFEWYCRFWRGRRTDDDARQIRRWRMMARHSGQVAKHGGGDVQKRARQRQTLLQWSWNPFPDC